MSPANKIVAQFQRLLLSRWKPTEFLLQKIETSTGAGIPDLFLHCPIFTGWIEVKSDRDRLNEYQINWLLRYSRANGCAYVLTGTPTLYLLSVSPESVTQINSQIKNPAEAGLLVTDWLR